MGLPKPSQVGFHLDQLHTQALCQFTQRFTDPLPLPPPAKRNIETVHEYQVGDLVSMPPQGVEGVDSP